MGEKMPRAMRSANAPKLRAPPVEALLATTRDAIVLISRAGTIEYTNRPTALILGEPSDWLIHRNIFDLIHPDDRAQISALFGRLISEPGRTESGVFRFRHADGSWRWLEGTGTNHLHVRGIEAVVAQFSERRNPFFSVTEVPPLELIEHQFRILVENAVHITAIVETDGHIRYISPVVERMLGYTPKSLERVHVSELLHPDDVARVMAGIERRMQQPSGPGQFVQFRARHRDGSWRALEAIAANRLDDPLIRGLVINARDVTERNWSADRLQHSMDALLAIHRVGRLLGSSSEQTEIERALLEGAKRVASVSSAVLLLRQTSGRLMRSRAAAGAPLWEKARSARPAILARKHALQTGEPQFYALPSCAADNASLEGWVVPLRVQSRIIGILEVHGHGIRSDAFSPELTILADQAAGAIERARLYQAIAERERQLEELVQRLLLAAEDERRRVAYEIHDGLAQLAAATQEHLEGFGAGYRSRNAQRRDEFRQALKLASETVKEARHVIAGLRPTVLDDFGLGAALAYEIQNLRAGGWDIAYTDELDHLRLDASVETALFRVAQEALANIRKHAQTKRAAVLLQRRRDTIHLEVRDWGRGFRVAAAHAGAGPSERVGLAGMQQRIALLSGKLSVQSRPGFGTLVRADVPLRLRATEAGSD